MTQKTTTTIVADACPQCPNGLLNKVSNLRFGELRDVTGVRCQSCGYQSLDALGYKRLAQAKKMGFKTE